MVGGYPFNSFNVLLVIQCPSYDIGVGINSYMHDIDYFVYF